MKLKTFHIKIAISLSCWKKNDEVVADIADKISAFAKKKNATHWKKELILVSE